MRVRGSKLVGLGSAVFLRVSTQRINGLGSPAPYIGRSLQIWLIIGLNGRNDKKPPHTVVDPAITWLAVRATSFANVVMEYFRRKTKSTTAGNSEGIQQRGPSPPVEWCKIQLNGLLSSCDPPKKRAGESLKFAHRVRRPDRYLMAWLRLLRARKRWQRHGALPEGGRAGWGGGAGGLHRTDDNSDNKTHVGRSAQQNQPHLHRWPALTCSLRFRPALFFPFDTSPLSSSRPLNKWSLSVSQKGLAWFLSSKPCRRLLFAGFSRENW